MKKLLMTSALTLFISLFFTLPVYADGIKVTIDGEEVAFGGQRPVVVGEHVLIPVRSVFEHLGYEVDWQVSGRNRLVSIHGVVTLRIGDGTVSAHGAPLYTSDVPAQIIGGSTMLTVSAIVECLRGFGHYAVWDSDSLALKVLSSDSEENILRIMNESADLLRERGHHVVVLGEVVRSQLLFARPGLAFGILYFLVDGVEVAAVNWELFVDSEAYGIFDSGGRPRMIFVRWDTFKGSRYVIPTHFVQVFDEEVLLLEERFLGLAG